MSILSDYQDRIKAYFSEWIKVEDKHSRWTIEDFPYDVGVDEELTKPHCWKCVSVNQCWFKNEENKKPKYFNYLLYTYKQIARSNRGIYHTYCHCRERAIDVPKLKDIYILECQDKIKDFFNRKSEWFYGWGYKNKDKDEFIKSFQDEIIQSYRQGNYKKSKAYAIWFSNKYFYINIW